MTSALGQPPAPLPVSRNPNGGGNGKREAARAFAPRPQSRTYRLHRRACPARPQNARLRSAGQLVECDRVPRVYETGSFATPIGECIWLREQRVQGTTLRTRLNAGALDFGSVIRLGIQLLSTLAQAESKRIVHRDIKPENVMVDDSGNFWLLDFGLARHLDLESLTATRHHFGVGTFGYSAPEQMRNRKREIDGRADLFAVGVLLYECATGSNPFLVGARDQLEVLRRVEQQPLPGLQIPADRDGAFADLVAAIVQKYPTQRPRSVAEALTWMTEIASAQGSALPGGRTT